MWHMHESGDIANRSERYEHPTVGTSWSRRHSACLHHDGGAGDLLQHRLVAGLADWHELSNTLPGACSAVKDVSDLRQGELTVSVSSRAVQCIPGECIEARATQVRCRSTQARALCRSSGA